MILTCPECATSYYVDDGRIPAAGRTVKCTSCGNRWHTSAQAALEPEAAEPAYEAPEADSPIDAEIAAMDDAAPAEAAEAVPAEDDLEITGPEETGLRRRAPRPASETPPPRKGALGAIIAWGAMAATVVLLVTGAIVFRGEVVKLFPKSSGAYAGLGLPVNSLGLVIEQVKAEPTFQGGRPVLSVTGQIRNVADHAAEAPALRIDILNRAGKPVAAKIARPIDAHVPAGAKRHFAIAIVDPPASAHDLQVAFETPEAPAHGGGPHKAVQPHAAEAELAHPAPVEAEPLPTGSPDALPNHG